ncbi:MBL fold metallo-hydrolase [Chitinophaga sp. 22620]|uniref:MBL fold metallo-hydrolase n=1 Tax=Chitinophaga sp. 22620 TaxID=3453952 RepID=UPI003F866C95
MSLFITSLNSGSNGNCYYIGNAEEAILVDAGISCRETERRMKRLGLKMDTVKAIFISHEHTDHISGVPVLAKKYRLPVYITGQTLHHSRMQLEGIVFKPQEPVTIGQLQVTAFVKYHDACDPHSFLVTGNGVTIGVFTDIGRCCDQLVHHFRQCHAAFLEANYDTDMLEKGRYPIFLKNRIRGGHGHLSNQQALDLFRQHKPEGMQVLLLSHLSRDNNDPALALDIFSRHAGNVKVAVASRYEESKVYEIFPGQLVAPPRPAPPKKKPVVVQAALF